tara:strand:+ start:2643 stop:2948 length:306 start_codon:yes stop_codon:yes gene_type:complete
MSIRLEPDGLNKFKILLPGKNRDYPIGVVWLNSFKKGTGWRLKSYFMTLFKDDHILNQVYDDSMKAARALATLYNRIGGNRAYEEDIDAFDFMLPDDTAAD